jgi:hypothetical protein
LEKIRHTNGPNPSSLPVDNENTVSVTSSVGKSSKNHEGPNVWCHYCDNNNYSTADFRAIAKLNIRKRLALKPKLDPERSHWPSFLKKSLNPKNIILEKFN